MKNRMTGVALVALFMAAVLLPLATGASAQATWTPENCPVAPNTFFGMFFNVRPAGPVSTPWVTASPDYINWGEYSTNPATPTTWLPRPYVPGYWIVKAKISASPPLTTPLIKQGSHGTYETRLQEDWLTQLADAGVLNPYLGPSWGHYTLTYNYPGGAWFYGHTVSIPAGLAGVYVEFWVWAGSPADLIDDTMGPFGAPKNPACDPLKVLARLQHSATGNWNDMARPTP